MPNRPGYCALTGAWLIAVAGLGVSVTAAAADNNKLSDTDSHFLQQASQDGMATTQLGQLALSKSSDPKIKQLAQQMVDDQGKANDQLKTLAQNKQITLPSAPGDDEKKQQKTLQSKQGDAFDEAWSKEVASEHQKTVKAYTAEGKDAKDADVKQFASVNVAALNSRLKTAQQLSGIRQARDDAMNDAMKAASSPMSTVSSGPAGGTVTTTPAESAAAAATKH